MFGAGCPSQPRSTRKAASRSGQLARRNGGNGADATFAIVVAQMMIPRVRSLLNPRKGANGRRTEASPAVTAIIIEANAPGCSECVGLRAIHPAAGRNVGDGGAAEADGSAAGLSANATTNAQRPRTSARRTVISSSLRTDPCARSRRRRPFQMSRVLTRLGARNLRERGNGRSVVEVRGDALR
jgi:hypothetical protein